MFEKLGQRKEALRDYQSVLKVDPTYRSAQDAIEALVEGRSNVE